MGRSTECGISGFTTCWKVSESTVCRNLTWRWGVFFWRAILCVLRSHARWIGAASSLFAGQGRQAPLVASVCVRNRWICLDLGVFSLYDAHSQSHGVHRGLFHYLLRSRSILTDRHFFYFFILQLMFLWTDKACFQGLADCSPHLNT